MLEAGAVREVLVSRQDEKWGLAIRLGGAGSRWLPLRTWASLTAVGRFAEALGMVNQSSKGAALMLRFRPTKVGADSEKRTKSGPY
ncbi:hypothetical protein Pfra02_43850 [Pseudomonas fragi]|nr:hypothetical protein Pfra02_43850 [Pseudomonas fragi]